MDGFSLSGGAGSGYAGNGEKPTADPPKAERRRQRLRETKRRHFADVSTMTLTTHATLGAVIGHAVGNPVIAFIFGFISHFLIDMVPHGDTGISDNFRVHKRKRKRAVAYVAVDAVVAIFFVLLLVNTRDIDSIRTFTWGIVGGVLPDLLVGLYELTKTPLLKWFNTLHFLFHDYFVKRKGDVPLYYALLAQIVFIVYLQTKL